MTVILLIVFREAGHLGVGAQAHQINCKQGQATDEEAGEAAREADPHQQRDERLQDKRDRHRCKECDEKDPRPVQYRDQDTKSDQWEGARLHHLIELSRSQSHCAYYKVLGVTAYLNSYKPFTEQ